MSRHQLPLREGVEATSAWIGWDRPLLTFFAQVFVIIYQQDGLLACHGRLLRIRTSLCIAAGLRCHMTLHDA